MRRLLFLPLILATILTSASVALLGHESATALSGSQFKAGRIIDDSVFFNGEAMSAGQVQTFLNSKVPVCDTQGSQPHGGTTRKAYAASQGVSTPFICLRNFTANTPARSGESGLCSDLSAKTGRTAAQIIDDVAGACHVSQKVLIVLLQKEQSLITDDWPWPRQYRSATGFGCPDTAPCDSQYYGFFNQVYNAARQFKRYAADPTHYNYRARATNNILYNPNAACGTKSVYIENQATAGLYNYTPYTPNSAALNNLYGSGNSCSAYGNRNFWRMYNDWFGSTLANYSGVVTSKKVYSDSARTQELSMPLAPLRSDRTIYVTVNLRNDGGKTWNRSTMRLGTVNEHNRSSLFADDSWISSARAAQLVEASVAPGGTGTFRFSMKTPKEDGYYNERFMALIEGVTWLSTNTKVEIPITVRNTYNGTVVSKESFANSNFTSPAKTSIRPETNLYWKVRVKNTGSNTWSNSITRVATVDPNNRTSDFVDTSWISVARPNNLKESSVAPGATGTFEFAVKAPEEEGIYTENFGFVVEGVSWMPKPEISDPYRVSSTLDKLFTSQYIVVNTQLQTGNQRRLVMQGDGNLVVYNSSGKATWNSGTKGGKRLVMQGDGNLVIYNSSNKPIWNTGTKGGNRLIMQGDGNLVIYNSSNKPIWNSATR